MNTLQRPLFRQAGGPAEMMPAGVAALPQADPVAMVAAVEQTTARDMESRTRRRTRCLTRTRRRREL